MPTNGRTFVPESDGNGAISLLLKMQKTASIEQIEASLNAFRHYCTDDNGGMPFILRSGITPPNSIILVTAIHNAIGGNPDDKERELAQKIAKTYFELAQHVQSRGLKQSEPAIAV